MVHFYTKANVLSKASICSKDKLLSWLFFIFILQVSSIPYKDQLADLVGCKPDLRRLFFRDPLLAFKCFFGPCCAAQYRLMGPGAWPRAKGVIEETYRNEMFPNVERKNETTVSKHQTIVKLLKLVFMFVTVATLKELSQDLRGEWDAVVGWLRAGRWPVMPGYTNCCIKPLIRVLLSRTRLRHRVAIRISDRLKQNTRRWT